MKKNDRGMYRYYSRNQPIYPWHPIIVEKWALNVVNWPHRRYIDEIGWPAWGYIDLSEPLTDEEILRYELTAPDPR